MFNLIISAGAAVLGAARWLRHCNDRNEELATVHHLDERRKSNELIEVS